MIDNKYDFVVLFSVKNANPNGDPLNGNRPRINHEGIGEVSDVCIKRKIRNRMMQLGSDVLIQSDDNKVDEYKSIKDRIENTIDKNILKDKVKFSEQVNKTWIDVRTFGQVFAFKGDDMSVGVRGPVSIHSAFSIDPINITSIQITKSVNSTGDSSKKSSDTMGMKHRVDFGLYKFAGSINPQLASKTGFSDEDVEVVKKSLIELFEDDASSARPDGSMEVINVYWWKHNNQTGQYSSAKVHNSLKVYRKDQDIEAKDVNDYVIELSNLEGLECNVIEGK
ncbi:CRISPR-associated protein Csd2 [Acetoanaerobium noterae]|uniref:CRISPR-associated protein Csd2 n=1 Tax=Acetoanaerobium noterae TaxID=745369 RepID=A0A1T5APF6_9FIRM|nr:type I-C CRISPR-associated protein Cas7/Csd2 [Acetoanaerobium noterae]SKB36707.1 CRISPR-associated protein Csd2 [Acetoanaerobium noterae]